MHRRLEDEQRQQALKLDAEVKQKNKWKERFIEENAALKEAQKEVSDSKVELADLRAKVNVTDRRLQELRDERDMFMRLRDEKQAKYTEVFGTNERLERELHSKRLVLAEFEDKKRAEFAKLKQVIDKQA